MVREICFNTLDHQARPSADRPKSFLSSEDTVTGKEMSIKQAAFKIHRIIDGTLSNPAVTNVGGNPRASASVRTKGRTAEELAAAVATLAESLVEIDALALELFWAAPDDGEDYGMTRPIM